ncbi:MAG TPA: HAD family hydrolase [Polyangia bacterium]
MSTTTPPRGRPAAFFDMDRTLLAVNSGTLWLHHLWRRGEISARQMAQALVWLLEYYVALVDIAEVTTRLGAIMVGSAEEELRLRCERWFKEDVAKHVTPAGVAAVERHRKEGHVLAILSGSSPYASQPLARLLGIPHVLCTRLEVEGGVFTGRMIEPVCYGAGKVVLAERFAAEQGVDLAASWFYSDSYSDLPMLARVGHPVAVNPDPRLGRHARRAGWPIYYWRL